MSNLAQAEVVYRNFQKISFSKQRTLGCQRATFDAPSGLLWLGARKMGGGTVGPAMTRPTALRRCLKFASSSMTPPYQIEIDCTPPADRPVPELPGTPGWPRHDARVVGTGDPARFLQFPHDWKTGKYPPTCVQPSVSAGRLRGPSAGCGRNGSRVTRCRRPICAEIHDHQPQMTAGRPP